MDRSLIAIAGGSCSGKTTIAHALAVVLPKPATLFSLDAYYRDFAGVSHQHINVDVPEALDSDLAISQLRELMNGRSVEQPVYDYASHARLSETTTTLPTPYIIVEGLFALGDGRRRGDQVCAS